MGRNSGGVTSSGKGGSSGGSKGATEKGYTAMMVKNIVGIEQKYRRNTDETLHVFNSNGDIIRSIGGKGAAVKFNKGDVPANSIITHNHPRSIGSSGINRIGNSFSRADVVSAIGNNVKEVRAVTPTYTFSLKRPKKGWGITATQAAEAFRKADVQVFGKGQDYLSKQKWSKSSIDRASVTHYHKIMKILAKKYGWDYSKKNN